jgi:ATP-dependent Clp protease, protease subunit
MAKKINTDLPEYLNQSYITQLIDKINEVNSDIELDWNSFGGSVYAGQRFADFLGQKKNKITANVSGIAASMGAVLLPYFDYVKGANQADIMIHSMAGDAPVNTWGHTNQFLYDSLAKKINEKRFKEITGYELKDVMMPSDNKQIDVWITGKQAGYIGLFDETYDLLDKAASFAKVDLKGLEFTLPENLQIKYGFKNNQIKTEMEIKDVTVNALQTGNREVYESIYNAGKKAEQTRVAEIMEYGKYDLVKAEEIVKSGNELSKQDVAYFIEKKMSAQKVAELETGSEKDFKTATAPKGEKDNRSAEEKEKAAALDELNDITGINAKIKK